MIIQTGLRTMAHFPARIIALAMLALAYTAAPPAAAANSGQSATAKPAVAIFAAGCFWCVEADFDKVEGVLDTTSGYAGGKTDNPSYEDVASESTGHVEAVRVTYDPAKVSYKELLDYYWRHTDVTDGRGQFCDRGASYAPVIFVSDDEQRALAETQKHELEASKRFSRIAVRIEPAFRFWPAETEHQNYYKKNPLRYRYYRAGCGRDARIRQIWGSEYTN